MLEDPQAHILFITAGKSHHEAFHTLSVSEREIAVEEDSIEAG